MARLRGHLQEQMGASSVHGCGNHNMVTILPSMLDVAPLRYLGRIAAATGTPELAHLELKPPTLTICSRTGTDKSRRSAPRSAGAVFVESSSRHASP